MDKGKKIPESLIVGYMLAFAGGFLDVYTFLCRGGVFANAQTGNIVLCGVSIARGDMLSVVNYLIPIIAFILGIAVSIFVKEKFEHSKIIQWQQISLVVEIISLTVVAFIPCSEINDMIVNVIISFVASLQVQSFRIIKGNVIATTMCTGNLRSATEAVCGYFKSKDAKELKKSFVYFSVILLFVFGAAVGALITNLVNYKSIFVPCTVLLVVFVLLFTNKRRFKRKRT